MNERDKELAKQAGMFYRECSEEFCSSFADGVLKEEMQQFADLIRADEREACANLCEDTHQEYEPFTGQPRALNYTCADAIRARGNT